MFKGWNLRIGSAFLVAYLAFYLGIPVTAAISPGWLDANLGYWSGALAVIVFLNYLIGFWQAWKCRRIMRWNTAWSFLASIGLLAILFSAEHNFLDSLKYTAFYIVPVGLCIVLIWSDILRADLSAATSDGPAVPAA